MEDNSNLRLVLNMIDNIDGSSSILRMLVAEALKKWTTDSLLVLLEDEDVIVRTAVARELQIRGELVIFKKMQSHATDTRSYMREIAAFVLGQLGTPVMPFKQESIPMLLRLASDSDKDVRAAVAAAFGHLCYRGMSREIEDCLIALCSDKDKDVRACAAYALGNSSGRREIRDLLAQLENQKYVGSYATLALEMLDESNKKI